MHRLVEQMLSVQSPYRYELFGSHYTGLNHEKSDIDLIVGLEPDELAGCEQHLARIGFQKSKPRGLNVDFAKASCEHDYGNAAAIDPFLYAVYKNADPKIDVLLMPISERNKRHRTLSAIRALNQDIDVVTFVKSLKGNHVGYRALHKLMEKASTSTD